VRLSDTCPDSLSHRWLERELDRIGVETPERTCGELIELLDRQPEVFQIEVVKACVQSLPERTGHSVVPGSASSGRNLVEIYDATN
jgi:hypothetical protein